MFVLLIASWLAVGWWLERSIGTRIDEPSAEIEALKSQVAQLEVRVDNLEDLADQTIQRFAVEMANVTSRLFLLEVCAHVPLDQYSACVNGVAQTTETTPVTPPDDDAHAGIPPGIPNPHVPPSTEGD